ncbi:MAG: hypothetical protein K5Q68_02015 [Roseococcus sp.]|nr:hypothetical protein [Roseococcus sp.]
MRSIITTACLSLLLVSCGAAIPPPPEPTPLPMPTREAPTITDADFPTRAQIAAGQAVPIRAGAVLGTYGTIHAMANAPSCGGIEYGRTGLPLPLALGDSTVTIGFNISERCPRRDSYRGLPALMMERAVIVRNGVYTSSATHECLLPQEGVGMCRVRQPPSRS